MTSGPEEQAWDRGWEGHQENQHRRRADLPLAEKLLWLEEAHRLVLVLGSNRPESGAAEGRDTAVTGAGDIPSS